MPHRTIKAAASTISRWTRGGHLTTVNEIIHIIDDNQAMREVLDHFLTEEGYEVGTFASAQKFLDAIRPDQVGCIVVHMPMPEKDGIDLLFALRERRILLPVIVTTDADIIALAVALMKQGVSDVLEKPVAPEILLASIRSALLKNSRNRVSSRELKRSSSPA
jgi:two-component system response regulator FixJ